MHDLHHASIRRMVEAGMAASQIMVISGHLEFSTFRWYVFAYYEAVKRAAQVLDALHALPTATLTLEYVN